MSDLWIRVLAYGAIVVMLTTAVLVWCCCKVGSAADDWDEPTY
jgi:hypothetical protein